MKEKCWKLLYEVYYYYNCTKWYYTHLTHIKTLITVFTAVVTTGSIAAWTVWQSIPVVWAVIVGTAQVAQVIYPLMPWEKRIPKMAAAIKEYGKFALDVEEYWNTLDITAPDTQEEDILKQYYKFKDRMQYLDTEVLPIENLHLRKNIREKMEALAKKHLENHC